MIHVQRSEKRFQNRNLTVNMRIAAQNPAKAIEVEENQHEDKTGFVARVFYDESKDSWYASTNKGGKGLVVYTRRKLEVGEKLKIKKVYDNCATAEIVLKHTP